MRKKRICIAALRSLPLFDKTYDCERVMGGAEINMYNLAMFLSQREDVEVKVIVNDFGQPSKYNIGKICFIRYGGSRTGKGFIVRLANKISSELRLFFIAADAFIFTTGNPMLGKLVILQQKLRGRKVIFRLSSDLNVDLFNYKRNNRARDYLLYKYGIRQASSIVCQSIKQKALLKSKLGLDSVVICNGFEINNSICTDKKKHILWVGRCMKSKRPMLFIELAEKMPDEKFVMIMPMNKEIPAHEFDERQTMANEVYERAARLDNMTLLEYVPYENIQDYYDNAKCYVCTSELEGFPNTFIQAALGAAPILSYIIDPDNIIERHRLGFVSNDDAEAAVKFLREINNDKLEEYKCHMYSYVWQYHNIKDTTEAYLRLM